MRRPFFGGCSVRALQERLDSGFWGWIWGQGSALSSLRFRHTLKLALSRVIPVSGPRPHPSATPRNTVPMLAVARSTSYSSAAYLIYSVATFNAEPLFRWCSVRGQRLQRYGQEAVLHTSPDSSLRSKPSRLLPSSCCASPLSELLRQVLGS